MHLRDALLTTLCLKSQAALQKGEGPTNSWELEGCTVHVSSLSCIALPENSSTP